MKILIVHNSYGSYSGEQHMIERVATSFEDLGHEVRCHFVKGRSDNFINKFITAYESISSIITLRYDLKRAVSLFQPDIVLIQNIYPSIGRAFLKYCKNMNIRVVMRLSNYRIDCPVGTAFRNGKMCSACKYSPFSILKSNCSGSQLKNVVYYIRNRLSYNALVNLDGYIAQNSFQRKYFENRLKNISIIHNSYSRSINPSTIDRKNSIVFLGRATWEKGFDIFLTLSENLPHYEFHFYGHADAVDIPSRIHNHGFLEHNEMVGSLRQHKYLVVPSRWFEGFPNVLLDGIAAGLIPIIPQHGAFEDISKIYKVLQFDLNGTVDLQAIYDTIESMTEDEISAYREYNYKQLLQFHVDSVFKNNLRKFIKQFEVKSECKTIN